MITLRFSAGVGWEAQVVKWGTWSSFSHVGFKLPDGTVLDASPKYGVMRRRATDDLTTEYWEALYPQRQVQAAVDWALTQVGKSYDWSAIAGFVIRCGKPAKRDWHDQRAWFCSELVEQAFNEAGIPLLQDSGEFNRITPRDLMLSTNLIRISKRP